MSKHLIIAVGGSGQTVVSHYLRYATMAGIDGNELPNIYILDADLKEAVRESETKPSLYGEIEKLHKRLVAGLSDANKPRLEQLYPYGSDSPLTNQQTFAEYLIGNRLGATEKDRKPVLDGFFGASEQALMIAEGFFARPNVGATAIFDKLYSDIADNVLTVLRRAVTQPDPPRVAVIGSTFGGTGSGGAPVIAQQLRKWAGTNSSIKIGTFLTLPWFSPGDLGKTFADIEDTQGKWETQVKNTAAGLRFYGTSKLFMDHVDVFLADYNGEKHARWDDSNTGQPEYPHCFNLILAAQIQNYLTRPLAPDGEPGQYSFYFLADQSNRRAMKLNGQDSALFRFTAGPLRQDLSAWAQQTQTLRLTLTKIADFINQGFKPGDASARARPQSFLDLAMALAKTCTHMPDRFVETGLIWKTRDANPKVYARLAKALNERAEQLGVIIAWLRDAWAQSNKTPELHPSCLAQDPSQVWDNYLALNRERNRNAEIGAIKIFNQAFKNAGNAVSDFSNRVEQGQQEPFDAASELVEKLLRKAIIEIGGSNDHNGDEKPPQIPYDKIPVALLPVQVVGNPQDHYTLPVELKQIIDHGRSREGKQINIFEESHPATLIGVSHYNVPSPWAAAHLNAWILSYGYDPAGNSPTLWQETRDGLSAIMWGIFTKRLQVHTIPYQQLSRLGRILGGSLRAELFGYQNADHLLDRIVYVSDAENRTVAVNHPVCGWFPAPGLLEGENDRWWESKGYALPAELPLSGTGSLEAAQMQAFLDSLEDLLAQTRQEDSQEPAAWYPAIGSLAVELRGRIPKGTQAAPTTTTEDKFFLLDKHEGSLFQASLKVLHQSREDLVAEFCVQKVAVWAKKTGGFRAADLPFRSEHLGRADLSAELLDIVNGSDGRPAAVRYRMAVTERGAFDIECPAEFIEPFYVHTEIWPKFKLPGWQFYFVGSADPTGNVDYGFALLDQAGRLIGDARRSFAKNHEISGIPEYLVFELTKENREAGVFRVGLEESAKVNARYFNLALDFGTSHSCVYATTTDGARIPLDFSKSAMRFGKAIFDNPEVKDEFLLDSILFLPFYVSQLQISDTSVLPSELKLINSPTRNQLGNGIQSFVSIPMRFSPANTGNRTLEERLSVFRGDVRTLGGSKWPDGLKGTDFEQEERGITKEYLRQILRIAAALLREGGYGTLNMFRATFPEAFSYPQRYQYAEVVAETFNALLRETGIAYQTDAKPLEAEQLLEIASPSLAERRNAQLKPETSGMVSESIAALESASDYAFFDDRGICIVLDMGGGTTDVAAYVSSGQGRRDDHQSIDSITDSIRYAGHDLLRLLANNPKVLTDLQKNPVQGEDEEARMRSLKILVRDEEYFKRLKEKFNNKAYLPETKEQMLLFFEGLFEYTRLLILAYRKAMQSDLKPWVVNIALFGNTWKLAELVYPTRDSAFDGFIEKFENYLKPVLANGETIHIHYQDLPHLSIKEATAAGALKLNPLDPKFHTPKEHASLAGLKVLCHKADGTHIEVAADEFLMGFDRDSFDRFAPLTVASLDNLRPHPFLEKLRVRYNCDDAGIFNQISAAINKAIHAQWIVPGDRDTMKFSPMRLFLEIVWKETIRGMSSTTKDKSRK